jgi:hypothetical protein
MVDGRTDNLMDSGERNQAVVVKSVRLEITSEMRSLNGSRQSSYVKLAQDN